MQASRKIQDLIGAAKTQEAINFLMDILKTSDKDLYQQVILISARYKKQIMDERIGVGFDKVVIAQVNQSLLDIANELPENTVINAPLQSTSFSAPLEKSLTVANNYETDLKTAQEADSQGDYDTAVAILAKYEDNLDIEGLKILGSTYLMADKNSKNYKKGLALIAKGAKQKDPMCLKIQAIYAYTDAETPEDFEQARTYFETTLETIDEEDYEVKDLYFMLGCLCFYGQGLKKSERIGLRYLKQSAEKGRVEAMVALMNIYNSGADTIEADPEEFLKWGKKAAQAGNEAAQYDVGIFYYGQEDFENAAEYLEHAADADNADAQFALGLMLMTGQGVKKDVKTAIKLYKKSAEQGNKLAQANLGSLYFAGEVIPQDYSKAYDLYEKASEQDFGVASHLLGIMYKSGLGVDKNKNLAKKYFQLAIEQGYSESQAELDNLNSFWGGLFS